MVKIPETHIIRVVNPEKGKAYIDGMSVTDFIEESYVNGGDSSTARAKLRRDLVKGVIVVLDKGVIVVNALGVLDKGDA